jgi:hypothetical protein
MKLIIHYKNNFQVKIFKVLNNKNHRLNINSKIRLIWNNFKCKIYYLL